MNPLRGQAQAENARPSVSAVLFALLIIFGFCSTFVAFGGALALSFSGENTLPNSLIPFFVLLVAITICSGIFFLAGYIASRISHQRLLFDALMHGLAVWACLSVIVVILLSSATAFEGLKRVFGHFSLAGISLVTDIEILKARAVTTLASKAHEINTPDLLDMRIDWFLIWAWWLGFFSLLTGFASALGGAYIGYKRRAQQEQASTRIF